MVQKLIDKHGHMKIIIAALLIGLASGIGGGLLFTPAYVNKKFKEFSKESEKAHTQQKAVLSGLDDKVMLHDALLDTLKNDLTCISISDSLQQIRRICDMEMQIEELLHETEKMVLQSKKRMERIQHTDTQTRQHLEKLENDIEKLEKEQRQEFRSLRNSLTELEEKVLSMQRRVNN